MRRTQPYPMNTETMNPDGVPDPMPVYRYRPTPIIPDHHWRKRGLVVIFAVLVVWYGLVVWVAL